MTCGMEAALCRFEPATSWVAFDKHIVSVGLRKSSYSEKWPVHVVGEWKQEGNREEGPKKTKKKIVKWNTQICNQT